MRHFGSFCALVAAFAFSLMCCGDNKPDPKSPNRGQGAEMTGAAGAGGGEAMLPPLDEVEPAKEDIEVPPAP